MSHFFTYELLSNGEPVFVGVGRRGNLPNVCEVYGDEGAACLTHFFGAIDCYEFVETVAGEHPALRLWPLRESRMKSELLNWLRSLEAMPAYRTIAGPVEFKVAKSVQTKRRRDLRKLGAKQFSARPIIKIMADKKPVYHPDHGTFKSVRAAAKTLDVSAMTISRYCRNKKDGWRFCDA